MVRLEERDRVSTSILYLYGLGDFEDDVNVANALTSVVGMPMWIKNQRLAPGVLC
jgi:hypothetical protein